MIILYTERNRRGKKTNTFYHRDGRKTRTTQTLFAVRFNCVRRVITVISHSLGFIRGVSIHAVRCICYNVFPIPIDTLTARIRTSVLDKKTFIVDCIFNLFPIGISGPVIRQNFPFCFSPYTHTRTHSLFMCLYIESF